MVPAEDKTPRDFYPIAYEKGEYRDKLPVWSAITTNPLGLRSFDTEKNVVREDIPSVPGAFQLHGVLTKEECQSFINLSEALGYMKDAAISLPREIRHNHNVVWIADQATHDILWQRVEAFLRQELALYNNKQPWGLNSRFRFYRYDENDFFKFHSDGAWPGSQVIDGKLVENAFPDRFSRMTFLVLLNDDFEGGATRFRVNAKDPMTPVRYYSDIKEVGIKTPAGSVLCFPHGKHPLHCVHSGEIVFQGAKYIIRTDVLFEL